MKLHFKSIQYIGIVLLAACMTMIPLYLMLSGTFKWQITQPEFVQGGIELVVFGLAMLAAWKLISAKKGVVLILLSALYLSMNGVIIPFVVDCLYFEILFYIGAVVRTLKDKGEYINGSIPHDFIAGVSVWGAGAIVCSLANHGTINDLRIYTLLLLLLCIFLSGKKKYENLYQKFINQVNRVENDWFQIVIFLTICLLVLALFAKTNTAQDYDTLWYGARPEKVLVGNHSFYDYLGYGSLVFYYPKLMELLYLPISNLGDYSFLQGANIFILIFIAIEMVQLMKKMYEKSLWKFSMPLTLLLISIPALANTSATAKPDILGMFFVLAAVELLFDYIRNCSARSFLFGMQALLLCTGTKLTYLLWGGILFLITILFVGARKIRRHKIFENDLLFADKLLFGLACICIAGVHLRTYRLTGYPIFPTLTGLFSKLGMKAKNFNSIQRIGVRTEPLSVQSFFRKIYHYIFDPRPLDHIVILWTSSLVFFIIGIFVLSKFKRHKEKIKLSTEGLYVFVISAVYFVVMIYYMCVMPIPDGNYFILPIAVICIFVCKYYKPMHRDNRKIDIVSRICIGMFIIAHLPVMFVSHFSWAYGTKAFSSAMIVDNFETKGKNDALFSADGIATIAAYVSAFADSPEDRFISSFRLSAINYRFPCAVEGALELYASQYTSSEIMGSYESFVEYVETIDLKGFILFNEDESIYADYVKKYVAEHTMVQKIEDQTAVYYERR